MNAGVPKGGVAPSSKRAMNLAQFLRQTAKRHAGEIALVWGERRWTWAELDRRVNAMAVALAARGIGKGDRVLVQSKNCNQMFESMFACFRLGAVWVPTNFRLTPEEVAQQARACGAVEMICSNRFSQHQSLCASKAERLRFFISIGPAPFGPDYDAIVNERLG